MQNTKCCFCPTCLGASGGSPKLQLAGSQCLLEAQQLTQTIAGQGRGEPATAWPDRLRPDSGSLRACAQGAARLVCQSVPQRTYFSVGPPLAEVRRHIAASKQCSAAKMGIREFQVDVWTSDVKERVAARDQHRTANRYSVSPITCPGSIYLVLSLYITEEYTMVA